MQGSKRLRGKSWELTVSGGFDVNGKRLRQTKTLKPVYDEKKKKLVPLSSNEADAELRKFIDEAQGPGYAGRMTVAKYLDYWYKNFIDPENVPEHAKKYKPRTKQWYKMNIDQYLIPKLGKIALRDLNAHDIKRALNQIAAERQISKLTVDGAYRVLRAALEIAVGTMIDRNPAKDKAARPPKPSKEETMEKHQVLDAEKAIIFLQAAKKQWDTAPKCYEFKRQTVYACYVTALYQAMRQGELLALKWTDVDFDNRLIKVKKSLVKGGTKPIFSNVKTDGSYRVIRMSKVVSETLQELKEAQKRIKNESQAIEKDLSDKKIWEDYDLVFCQQNGRPLYPFSLTRWHLRHTLLEAKLPQMRFHDLRATAATLLYETGEDPWTIASICGQSAPQVAFDHYIHKKVKHQDRAIENLDQLLQKKPQKNNAK